MNPITDCDRELARQIVGAVLRDEEAAWEPVAQMIAAAFHAERERIAIPDFETAVRMVAAHIHVQGKYYIEIGVEPETKEVGWTFEPTERDESHAN